MIEMRMNAQPEKYMVSSKVVDKTVAGTRTKRTTFQYNNSTYSIDSAPLYNNHDIGDSVKLLYFPLLDIVMIPGDDFYFDVLCISLVLGCFVKLLDYLK
jgi:hypothetical protein